MPSRSICRGDAFDRALKLTFGADASLVKVEQARTLYARYRTDELLERLKAIVVDKTTEDGVPKP
jgi:hypothetical protein